MRSGVEYNFVVNMRPAANRAGLWLVLLAIAAMMAAGLGGCASGSLGGFFSGSGSNSNKMAPVTFAPIIGAPPEVSKELTGQIATAAQRNKIPVVEKGSSATYTVRGYLATSNDSKNEKLAYIWDVTDKSGKRVHRITGEETISSKPGADVWSSVDQSALQKIASKTAADLASWLPGQSASGQTGSTPKQASAGSGDNQRTASARNSSGEVLAHVPPVQGAPGDGEKSLTLALKKKLFSKGVKLARSKSSGVYSVQGKVTMGKPSGGQQSIKIDWVVSGPDGGRLGTVSQQNKVPEGALDGEWGSIADAAAAAAADGIVKLLPKNKS